LGVYRIRWELEEYEYISTLVNQKLRGQREVIEEARTKVEDMLKGE